MDCDLVVVGGGLGGLAAATLAARGGMRVALLERASELGGRARSQRLGGGIFNLGPHALYRKGPAMRVLDALGVAYPGGVPSANGNCAFHGGRLHALPSGPLSLLSTDLLRFSEKVELVPLLARLQALDPESLYRVPLEEFIDSRVRGSTVRQFLRAIFRVSTYVNDPAHLSAGVAVRQLQRVVRYNVLYLDGGWSPLVAQLEAAAEAAGVAVRTGVRAVSVERRGERVAGIRLSDDSRISSGAVVVAGGEPGLAAALLGSASLERYAQAARPVRAACLDLALSSLPFPRRAFALGIDLPAYASVHSRTARLGDAGVTVLHLAQYLAPGQKGEPTLGGLEALMDAFQPGWRAGVLARRFLPGLTVMHDCPTADRGGYAGRAPVAVADLQGAYVVGDWVGDEGLLADAVLASAERAATALLMGHAMRSAA